MRGEADIRRKQPDELLPQELLLLADPEWTQVEMYLHSCDWFLAESDGRIIGVCGLMGLEHDTAEIMNAAVDPAYQGRGHGKRLILHTLAQAAIMGYEKVVVRTGNSSLDQLGLYQKCGFRMTRIERDYFVNNYPEPIYENGIPCRDRITLEMNTRE
ncbi:GNAT family N-acetyltransferase [Paenibacillus sp. SAF-054]|uniref:GNAT family N-acetyltransferase n=1 Tax=unclassified Paenibacillus TaxID=185978 RepID=UPI003F7D6654